MRYMKKIIQAIKLSLNRRKKLDPDKPAECKQIIDEAVKRTVKGYGEALKKLGTE